MRGLLSNERYEELKKLVVEMFEEAEVNSLPIDCFYIAKKLHYVLRPYSQLDIEAYLDAMDISVEGYSQVEESPVTGMYEYVIYYNSFLEPINDRSRGRAKNELSDKLSNWRCGRCQMAFQ